MSTDIAQPEEYKLKKEAYFITVNEANNLLYTAIKDKDGGWNINSYDISQ